MILPLILSLQTLAHADALRIEVEGMICVSCEAKIKQKLEQLGLSLGMKFENRLLETSAN